MGNLSSFYKNLLVAAVLLFFQTVPAQEVIRLAFNKSTEFSIVLPATASPTEQFSGEELGKYLNQISEANFEQTQKLTESSIIVSSASRLQEIDQTISLPDLNEEGYAILKQDNNLYLIGGSDRAVLYAVYDFLSRLGCRWIAPSFEFFEDTERHIPEQTNLEYSHSKDIVENPVMEYRKIYIEEGLTHKTENLLKMIDWMPKNRYNVLVAPIDYQGHGRVKWDNWREELTPELQKRGIIIEVGGHGYQNFLNAGMEDGRLFQQHPEWFGMEEDGSRSKSHRMVFCTSNPEAVNYLHENISSYLEDHPEIRIFDFWPPDGERWCTGPVCKALGSPTDRHALLVSQTSRFLEKEYPEVRLECIAYMRYLDPPQNVALDDQILLDFCPIDQNFEYQIYEEESPKNSAYKQQLLNWQETFDGDISIYSYYRKYAWGSLPILLPNYMQKDLQYYQEIGVDGISTYAEPGDWFTYGLNHYVLGHLAWNPEVDVDQLMEEYSSLLYGPASGMAVAVQETLEEVLRFATNIPHTSPKSPTEYAAYLSRIKECCQSVASAIDKYSEDESITRNLGHLAMMLDYAEKNIRLTDLKANDGPVEKIEKLNEEIRNMVIENSGLGVVIHRVFRL